MSTQLRHNMNHIGIGFPKLEPAVEWYRDVLGCHIIVPPMLIESNGDISEQVAQDIFGEKFGGMKFAHVTTACGMGIEMFEYITPKAYVPDNTFDYARTGLLHICLTTPDIEASVAALEKGGGKRLSKIWSLYKSGDQKFAYCQDPWGTVIEFYTLPYTQACLHPPD